ncbi:MAG: 23S rRNA (pseudouridine(1915)-N(3))-methyltransferase RlmH [Collinsella sp.]
MKYTVVCVGKLKERFWKDACAEYTKRLGAYAKVDIREVADIDRLGGRRGCRARQGRAAILAALPSRAHVILLAIEGKERSSEGSRPVSMTSCCEATATSPL